MSRSVVNSVRSGASMSKVCGLEIRKPFLGSAIDEIRRNGLIRDQSQRPAAAIGWPSRAHLSRGTFFLVRGGRGRSVFRLTTSRLRRLLGNVRGRQLPTDGALQDGQL